MVEPVAKPVEAIPAEAKPKVSAKRESPTTEMIEGTNYEDFEATKGVPFAASELGVADYYKNDFDGETKPKVDAIMSYLAKFGNLVNLGKDIIGSIKSKLDIQEDEKPLSVLERIYKFVLVEKRLIPLRQVKQRVEKLIEEEKGKAEIRQEI